MSNDLSTKLLAELYKQESPDPLLMLVTLSHASFPTLYLVNNVVSIISRGNTYQPFPMKIKPSGDDGETARTAQITFDNVSLELIDELRTITDPMDAKLEAVLATDPDIVEVDLGDMKVSNIVYNKSTIRATLVFDDFLNTELTSENYTSSLYPGIFS